MAQSVKSTGHEAFYPQTAVMIKGVGFDLTAFDTNGDQLIFGTSKGGVVVYNCSAVKYGEKPEVSPPKFRKEFLGREKGPPITQLQAVAAFDLLFSLAEGVVYIHKLSTMELVSTTKDVNCKNVTMFTAAVQVKGKPDADTHRHSTQPLPDRSDLSLKLACVQRRQVLILDVKAGTCSRRSEMALPETPRAIAWCGREVVIGFRKEREYVLLDTKRKEATSVKNLTTTPEPMVLSLPDNEHILAIEDSGRSMIIFRRFRHEQLHKFGIDWKVLPKLVEVLGPYVIGVTNKNIEIKSFARQSKTVQTIEIADVTHMSRGNALYVMSKNTCYVLQLLPIDLQVDKLKLAKDYEQAERLAPLMDKPEADIAKALSDIKRAHARALFQQGHFEAALSKLKDLPNAPKLALQLYPWLLEGYVEPDPTVRHPELSQEEKNRANANLADFLTDVRKRFLYGSVAKSHTNETEYLEELEVIDTMLLQCYLLVEGKQSLVSVLVRMDNNHCSLTRGAQLLKEHNCYEELIGLYRSRGAHGDALNQLKVLKGLTVNQRLDRMANYLMELGPDHLDVILKYLPDILQSDLALGLEVVTTIDYPEVKALPRDKVLAKLQALASTLTKPGQSSTAPTDEPNEGPLTPNTLVVRYLERVRNRYKDNSAVIHTSQALAYFDTLVPMMKEYVKKQSGTLPPLGQEPAPLGPERQRLFDFLASSTRYEASKVLSTFKSKPGVDALFKAEQAILYGRVGRHQQALEILVYEQHDYDAAALHCRASYNVIPDAPNVYMMLLKIYLEPGDRVDAKTKVRFTQEAMKLLRSHPEKIAAMEALNMLSLQTKVQDLGPFFHAIWKNQATQRRQTELRRSLCKTENLQMRERQMVYHKRSVTITEVSLCAHCHRAIRSNHAFVVHPCGMLVHLGCHDENKQLCPKHGDSDRCRLQLD
eukprot:TRINITY_DN9664_c0_g1_i3.p1 TRINITY_DN9664_c0_g1~~TRINITY_DN9664_c0_g1_i3.p1  ORF type:complete len:933 (+),score=202.41 TRINITY_DN9664_c0_g1_i3:2-2800(+)